ncbi:MAG: DUF3313 family protein [Arenimonas sp.]|nr:DUF3313 family protein [Arenimonas sp.]
MKLSPLLSLAAAVALAAGAATAQTTPAAAPPTSARQATAEFNQDGLQRTEVRGLDIVFVRPGATLEGFTKVQLTPVQVAFRRNWERQATTGSRTRVRARDMERIRDQLSTLVETEIRQELERGGYMLVEDAGEDVLSVQAAIVNLNINAPDLATTSRVRVYTTSVGEMTLVADLRDSSSGELLMRVYDRRVGRTSMQPEFTTRADNVMQARIAARAWAQALRAGLDGAKTVTAAP